MIGGIANENALMKAAPAGKNEVKNPTARVSLFFFTPAGSAGGHTFSPPREG